MVEAAPQARPEDHLGGIFRSSFAAEYHLGLTSALQHCQHNGAFRFLAAQVSIDFGRISGPPFGCVWPTLAQQLCFLACGFTGHVFERFRGLNLSVLDSRIKYLVWKVLQKPGFHICRDYGSGTNFDDFWWPGGMLETS